MSAPFDPSKLDLDISNENSSEENTEKQDPLVSEASVKKDLPEEMQLLDI